MSGAQAAAADLARMRAPEDAPAIDEAMLESARGVLASFDTYFKSSRTYPEGYPARERFLTTLDEKLRAHHERYGDLVAELTPKGAAVEGQPVFETERAEQNLWYPLYRDGIRELTLEPGMPRDEAVELVKALVTLGTTAVGDGDDGEDDAVTLLWDYDFEHVSYVAIDTFVSGGGGDTEAVARLERIRDIVTVGMMKDFAIANLAGSGLNREIGIARKLKSIALNKADLTFLQTENLGALAELPARVESAGEALFAISPAERDAFAAALQGDDELLDKFLEAAIRALVTEGGSGDVGALCARIEQFFTSTVVGGQFQRATGLRRRAQAVLENRGGTPVRAEIVDAVDRAMSSDAAIAAILGALAKRGDGELAELYALIEALPARAAPGLVRALEQVAERPRRRAVCDVVAKWGPRALDAATAVLPQSGEDYAIDILYLIRKIGSERAIAVLEEATRHGAAAVRAGAVRLYVEVAPREPAGKRARTALRDPDSLVRAVAVEAILRLAPSGAGAWIEELIHADGFAKADATEKARLFLAYARLGGDEAAAELMERLGQRNLLMSARVDEERAAAARALAQIGHEPARAVIEKLAKAKMARSALSEACTEALAVFGQAAPVEPAPAPVEPAPAPVAAPVAAAPKPPDTFVSFKPKGGKNG